MSQLPLKKIVLGMLATLVFLGSVGTIGWVVNAELKKERENEAMIPGVKDLILSSSTSKSTVSPPTEEPASLESKSDAKKVLDAMDLSAATLDENIE